MPRSARRWGAHAARVIDVSERAVIPGFIDTHLTHVHLTFDNARAARQTLQSTASTALLVLISRHECASVLALYIDLAVAAPVRFVCQNDNCG